jgi:nitrite reductase/ring-hydroxylating ferredoxin subunit/uncharacterized membrane protein
LSVLGGQKWLDRPSYRLEHALTFAYLGLGGMRHRVNNVLHGVWLGHPLHPALAGLSTGSIGTTVALDALSALPGRPASEVHDASKFARRALGFGIVANLGAAVTGVTDWQHTHEQARRIGLIHGAANTVAIGLYAMSWRDRRRGRHRRGIAASAFGYAITMASSYLGGALVFDEGIGTDRSGPWLDSPQWAPTLPLASLPEQKPLRVDVDGVGVILCRTGEMVSALGEYCPHLAAPMADGWIDRGGLVCPWHGSRFAVDSGEVRRGPSAAALPCYQTRVRDGIVEVRDGAPQRFDAGSDVGKEWPSERL